METKRESPEPESGDFYEIVSIAEGENEATVVGRATTLLWPIRDLTRNNHKTKDLHYRMDTQWQTGVLYNPESFQQENQIGVSCSKVLLLPPMNESR